MFKGVLRDTSTHSLLSRLISLKLTSISLWQNTTFNFPWLFLKTIYVVVISSTPVIYLSVFNLIAWRKDLLTLWRGLFRSNMGSEITKEILEAALSYWNFHHTKANDNPQCLTSKGLSFQLSKKAFDHTPPSSLLYKK